MIAALAFVVLAALGAIVRALAQALAGERLRVPIGTLAVNVAGSLLLGLLAGWDAPAVTVAGVGGLGAMTTFSTFADEVVGLWRLDRAAAITYVAVSVAGGVGAAWVALRVAG